MLPVPLSGKALCRVNKMAADMEYRYRSPTAGDENRLGELCVELGYPSSGEAVARRLNDFLGHDDHLVLVAINADDKPIGWIHAVVAHRIESDAFVELGGLVVSESQRGRGIGTALLAKAEQWARKRGAKVIRVRSNVVRERAQVFYLETGYKQTKTTHVFQKNLR